MTAHSLAPGVTSAQALDQDALSTQTVRAARQLADDVLWPDALAIDGSAHVTREILDRLAAAGLYGVAGPREAGGAALDPMAMGQVIEVLGGASLATAFVWIQHHSAVRAVAVARRAVRGRWLTPMCAGTVRSGIAIAALRRPGPPAMVATPDGEGLILDGFAPWVTGWGLIDTVYVGARDGDDITWSLLDAATGPTASVEPLRLAAVDAASTVELRLREHRVPAERVIAREPYADWRARDAVGLATNGFLAVGVADRCARLLDSAPLTVAVDEVRDRLLDAQDEDAIVEARTDASLLAVRATTALVVAGGGRSVSTGDQAQRLAREALFLLVFGQTGPIRAAQTARLLG